MEEAPQKRNSSGIPCLVDSTRGGNAEEDFPFSVDKRSPPPEEYKWKAEWVFLLGLNSSNLPQTFIQPFSILFYQYLEYGKGGGGSMLPG